MEDRGFGGMDPESYRKTISELFESEPQLKKLLPFLWADFRDDANRFFRNNDGSNDLDFAFAKAVVAPTHSMQATWREDAFAPFIQIHACDERTYILRQSSPRAIFQLQIGDQKAELVGEGEAPEAVRSTAKELARRYTTYRGLPAIEEIG